MSKSLFLASILCLAAIFSFGQYGYDDSYSRDSRPEPTRRNDGLDYQDLVRRVERVARPIAQTVSHNPEIGRDVAKGAQKAKRGIKAVVVAIGAAIVGFFNFIVGFFKWLSNLFYGKKEHQ